MSIDIRPVAAVRPGRTGGFTLIEIVVVTAIIGILAGLVVLSIGDGGGRRQVEREARRLATVLELASDMAVRNGTELGVRVEPTEYRFFHLEDEKWQPIDDSRRGLDRHSLAEGVRLRTRVEGFDAELGESGKAVTPQIMILSSGEMTPFEIRVKSAHSGRSTRVSGALTGEISLERDVQG